MICFVDSWIAGVCLIYHTHRNLFPSSTELPVLIGNQSGGWKLYINPQASCLKNTSNLPLNYNGVACDEVPLDLFDTLSTLFWGRVNYSPTGAYITQPFPSFNLDVGGVKKKSLSDSGVLGSARTSGLMLVFLRVLSGHRVEVGVRRPP